MLSRTLLTLTCLAVFAGCDDDAPAADAATDVVTVDTVTTDTGNTNDVVATDTGSTNDGGNTNDVVSADRVTTDAVTTDTGATTDAGGTADASATFEVHAPCNAASAYMDATAIAFGGALGSTYSPNCVRVRAGSMVTWTGSFSGHPLASGSGGTSGSPIPSVTTGSSTSVTFRTAGFYPFYCTRHSSGDGTGMAGVVWVVP